MGQLAVLAHLTRDLAEVGPSRREGRAGADASLAGEHDTGYLPAVRAGVAAARCRQADGTHTGECPGAITIASKRKQGSEVDDAK